MVVGIAESAFLRAGDGCAQSGEDDYVVGVLLEDVLETFLDERHFQGTLRGGELKILLVLWYG